MKTNKDFRLSKPAKRQLALMPSANKSVWKKCFIESELHASGNRNDPLQGIGGGKSARARDNKGE